jgi:hypothetical protein
MGIEKEQLEAKSAVETDADPALVRADQLSPAQSQHGRFLCKARRL